MKWYLSADKIFLPLFKQFHPIVHPLDLSSLSFCRLKSVSKSFVTSNIITKEIKCVISSQFAGCWRRLEITEIQIQRVNNFEAALFK